ncbi:MAG TPA: hypothetical protein VGO00_19520 [Kofleriaceae bacterium]|nr:hypothetical protein [Kofleriaceae bacterium]
MASQYFESRDEKNAGLHGVIAVIEKQLTHLPSAESGELRESWSQLMRLLDLPPVHELRDCPVCGHVGMRAATRCGHCWTALVPPAATAVKEDGSTVVRGND